MIAGERGSIRPKLAIAAKIALSVGLIAFLVSRLDPDDLRSSLRGVRPMWLAAAFGLLVASNVLGAWQWGRLLREVGIGIPFWKVCAYYHVGLFFNNFLPANIGGDIARVADASRYADTRAAALSAVLMDRLIGTVALGGLALVTTLPVLDRFHLTLIYLVLVLFFAAGAFLLWAVSHPAMFQVCERILRRVGLVRVLPQVEELAKRLGAYRNARALIPSLLAVATVTQVARVGVHALVARSLGIEVGLGYFFLFVPLLAVIVSLPISLNGIGVREGAGILVFGLVGVSRAPAFSLQFVTYLVSVAVSLLGGLVFLARIPRRRARAVKERGTSCS